MLKLYQDLSAESERLGLPQKPFPLLLMDVNVLLPYKSAPFSRFLHIFANSNKSSD